MIPTTTPTAARQWPACRAAVRQWDAAGIAHAVLELDGRPLELWSGGGDRIETHLTTLVADQLDGGGSETRLRVAAGLRSLWVAAVQHQPAFTVDAFRQATGGLAPDRVACDPGMFHPATLHNALNGVTR